MSKFIPTSELDFLAYRNSIKEYLKTQEAFRDYDYEGSNMAVMLDILALNSLQNAYYENMIGSEMFLDTALLKNSVVSRAKELNYTPRSRSASRASVTISFNTANANPTSLTIPKYYNFKSDGYNGNNVATSYNFVSNNAVIVQPDSFGNFVAEDVMIYQGVLVSEGFLVDGSRYVLQSNTIDIDSIEVTIQNSNTDNTSSVWVRTTEIYGITGQSNVYFVQGNQDDKYELVFGNDVIGRALLAGNIVLVKYLSTTGEEGNSLIRFSGTTAVEGFSISSVIADTKTYGGSEKESIEDVRFQAPRYFTTQERAVIETDYENLVRLNFPSIQAVIAYGGERLVPPQYGYVAISMKPYGIIGNVSDRLKSQIINFLKTKSMQTPVVINPEYFYIKVASIVYYNPNINDKSLNQLKASVLESISDYGADTLSDFGSDFRYSKLTTQIDNTDTAIVSNDTDLRLVKRWIPKTGSSEDTKIDFGIPLLKFELEDSFAPGAGATLSSTLFSYTVGSVNYSGYFEDDGLGKIRIISNTTVKTIILDSAGSVDYDTGIVLINANLVVSSFGGGFIGIQVVSRNKDLLVNANRFLILDPADVSITMEKSDD